ncbi:hypothetical protein MHYP_G00321210 [Metynnis hypsauchen]
MSSSSATGSAALPPCSAAAVRSHRLGAKCRCSLRSRAIKPRKIPVRSRFLPPGSERPTQATLPNPRPRCNCAYRGHCAPCRKLSDAPRASATKSALTAIVVQVLLKPDTGRAARTPFSIPRDRWRPRHDNNLEILPGRIQRNSRARAHVQE